jgi:Uma2 family endonuclease
MTQVLERLVTPEEFATLPCPPEGGKVELVRGRVVTMPPVGPEHGEIASEISTEVRLHLRSTPIGVVRVETGYWLSHNPDIMRAPDVSFVLAARVRTERVYYGAVDQRPDLAIEITSPSDRDTDVATKVGEYLAAGVPRTWVVRPELKTVTVHRPDRDAHTYSVGDTLTSDDAGFPVEGFALELGTLFGEGRPAPTPGA